MVFNATFSNISVISWWSVLLVEQSGVPKETHRLVVGHWQTLTHNVISSTPRNELTTLVVISINCTTTIWSRPRKKIEYYILLVLYYVWFEIHKHLQIQDKKLIVLSTSVICYKKESQLSLFVVKTVFVQHIIMVKGIIV
jgi:hypothetical protein